MLYNDATYCCWFAGAFWFMSGGWSNSSASSTASSNDSSKSVDIHLGFRATKVAFERGWFNPSVLSNNTSYNSLDPDRSNSLVTNYPVGMILAKDVTIKMVFTEAVTQDVVSSQLLAMISQEVSLIIRSPSFQLSGSSLHH